MEEPDGGDYHRHRAFYAVPNLFGEDHAVQVVGTRGADVTVTTQTQVNDLLQSKGIGVKRSELENGQLLVRVNNAEQQLLAKEAIAEALGDKFSVALNLAPATPAWLESLGGSPMKLGLDLRGGVHFLMEVDMGEAIRKMEEAKIADFRSQLREEGIRYSGVKLRPKVLRSSSAMPRTWPRPRVSSKVAPTIWYSAMPARAATLP